MIRIRGVVLAFLVLVLAAASPAFADVKLKMTIATTGGPMAMTVDSTLYVKAMKMRADASVMGQNVSVLVDAATKQQLLVNHVTKQIIPLDPKAGIANLPVTMGEATASVKPNGQVKDVLGRSCRGYQVNVTMPITAGSENVTMTMSGVAWIAREGAGVADYQAFYKAAAAAGLSVEVFARGLQSKAIDEMYGALAQAGMPMLQELHVAFEGGGQKSQALSAMAINITTTVTDVSTDPIPDEVFALPADYTRK